MQRKEKDISVRNTSIIVPCYNESKRGSKFLKELVSYSKRRLKNYEIILVDDGSKDDTLSLLKKTQLDDKKNVRVIVNEVNLGKGASIRKAIFSSTGKNILFIDADGSISPSQIPDLLAKLNKHDLAIGYRYSQEANVKQPYLRKVTGTLFNLYVNILFNLKIYDCLCGFKAFKRDAALFLFKDLKDTRWLFDVEILFKAKRRNYSIEKLPITWEHREGTKIKVYDPFIFLFKLIGLRLKLMKN